MSLVTFDKSYNEKGFKRIAGMDEAGRGPLAGPVVCALVIMPLDDDLIIEGVNDSKKLTEKKREELYELIMQRAIKTSVQLVDNDTIDIVNILNATRLAMNHCINDCILDFDYLLCDYITGIDVPNKFEAIVKGDATSYNIACASIVAKVTRDRLVREYDKLYPNFSFSKHKGYGTKQHIEELKKFGATEIHRKTFIKNFVAN
ncbi:MAG: ribonuclease HII [Clostridia bacterium]|nr:ribonuclease HII [Clostridia bacterium]